MSCCRTAFVILSFFLSIFIFVYGVFLYQNSKSIKDTRQSTENSQQNCNDPQDNSGVHQTLTAYMPDAKTLKFHHHLNKDTSSYFYKVSSEFLKRKIFNFINERKFLIMKIYLVAYEVNETTSHDCNTSYPPPKGKKCLFDLGPCYDVVKNESLIGAQETRSLCMFVKVKNDFKFIPRFYNSLNFPREMPNSLKEVVKSTPRKNVSLLFYNLI
jgi:hypothetical protein